MSRAWRLVPLLLSILSFFGAGFWFAGGDWFGGVEFTIFGAAFAFQFWWIRELKKYAGK